MAKKPRRGRVFWVARDAACRGGGAFVFKKKPVWDGAEWMPKNKESFSSFLPINHLSLDRGECLKVRVVEEGR